MGSCVVLAPCEAIDGAEAPLRQRLLRPAAGLEAAHLVLDRQAPLAVHKDEGPARDVVEEVVERRRDAEARAVGLRVSAPFPRRAINVSRDCAEVSAPLPAGMFCVL